jgi:hypothetical protein
MYKEVLRAIVDIDTFPVISLVLFVVVFALAVVRAVRMDRRTADMMASLPLDDRGGAGRQAPPLIEGASRGA